MVPEKKTIREEEALYAAAVNDHRGEKKIKRREQGVLRIYVRDSFPLFPSFLRPPQIPQKSPSQRSLLPTMPRSGFTHHD